MVSPEISRKHVSFKKGLVQNGAAVQRLVPIFFFGAFFASPKLCLPGKIRSLNNMASREEGSVNSGFFLRRFFLGGGLTVCHLDQNTSKVDRVVNDRSYESHADCDAVDTHAP